MIFIPMVHQQRTPAPTRYSRELGQRFDETVREFKRQHPDLTDADVRTALATSLKQAGSPEDEARQRRLAFVALLGTGLAFIGVALSGGNPGQDSEGMALMIMGIVVAAAGVAVAVIRLSRRD